MVHTSFVCTSLRFGGAQPLLLKGPKSLLERTQTTVSWDDVKPVRTRGTKELVRSQLNPFGVGKNEETGWCKPVGVRINSVIESGLPAPTELTSLVWKMR